MKNIDPRKVAAAIVAVERLLEEERAGLSRIEVKKGRSSWKTDGRSMQMGLRTWMQSRRCR